MKAPTLLFIGLSALATQANASSPAAWAGQDKAIAASCSKASQLKNVQPVATPALFSDQVGYTALLLQGRYPQTHMKNRRSTELCLYNRKTKTAHVTEWDSVKPAS